jgi:hypothetical protein
MLDSDIKFYVKWMHQGIFQDGAPPEDAPRLHACFILNRFIQSGYGASKQLESLSVCLYQRPLGTALFADNATNFRPSSGFLLFFSISQGMVEFETGV